VTEKYHYDESEDRLYVRHEEDLEPVVDNIKQVKQQWDGRGDTSLGYFVGTIPAVVWKEYCKVNGVSYHEFLNNNEHIHRIMNNPDYSKFRVFEGKIGNGN